MDEVTVGSGQCNILATHHAHLTRLLLLVFLFDFHNVGPHAQSGGRGGGRAEARQ